MKRCPECKRDYYDETQNFCLEDGSRLISGSSPPEPPTVVLSQSSPKPARIASVEANTEAFTSTPPAPGSNSVAVLPFVNMSADAENEYFCDGLAEELLNALAKIDELKVAARTASFSFRGKNAPMSEIGERLNVNSILEGSVRKAGSRVRITVQLINAADGYHIWSERYDRDMTDIFVVQDEISSIIA